MKRNKNRRGFTKLELCVVVGLVVVVVLVMLPAVSTRTTRGTPGSAICMYKQKDIVLAANLYEMKYRRLPPSCHVKKYTTAEGETRYRKDGYSFLVDLLPEMEQEALYKRMNVNVPLDVENDVPPPQPGEELPEGVRINLPDESIKRSLPMFRCPSTKTQSHVDGQRITNYKAVSATTRRAYEVSSREDVPEGGLDIYGTGVLRERSDGVMYVGSRTKIADITDGTTHTLMITESEEPVFSRWLVGQECGLYTMRDGMAFSEATDAIRYVHPAGYVPPVPGKKYQVPNDRRQTNLNRDYVTSPYPWGEDGFRSSRYSKEPATGPRFGPGSGHDGVIIHAFVGGAAEPISKNIDAAVYFFLTTRAGADPGMKQMGINSYELIK